MYNNNIVFMFENWELIISESVQISLTLIYTLAWMGFIYADIFCGPFKLQSGPLPGMERFGLIAPLVVGVLLLLVTQEFDIFLWVGY